MIKVGKDLIIQACKIIKGGITMRENAYGKYKDAAIERNEILLWVVIGFLIGFAFCVFMCTRSMPGNLKDTVSLFLFVGFIAGGIPYLWIHLPQIGSILNPFNWFALVLKFFVAASFGIFFTYGCLLFRVAQTIIFFIQMKLEEKSYYMA